MHGVLAKAPGPAGRRKATSVVLRAYRDNRARLAAEMAKESKDRFVENNIRAYLHILQALEERYDLEGAGVAAGA